MADQEPVDVAFIRRAVELADPDAVRVALFQNTGDANVAALPPSKDMSDSQRAALVDKAVDWLVDNASGEMPPEPPAARLRELMTMATGREMTDVEYEARRDLPAFRRYPFAVEWEGDRPEIPAGFSVAIIGAGFSGLAAAMQCTILGIP
ncbi:MAG: hypothetical protein PHE36_11895, partial [Novosphingobium sp.]|nr:hypothetical protein [Novosphingobium sp.]